MADWKTSVTQQVEDKVKAKTMELAQKAADELTKKYDMMMLKFYGEYDPKRYKNTGGLAGSGHRFYKNSHGGLGFVYGGVEFGSDFMPEVYRAKEGASRVFESFLNGYHGPEFVGIKAKDPMLKDPYNELLKYRDFIKNNLV